LKRRFQIILSQPQAEVSHYLPQYLFVCDEYGNLAVDIVAKFEDGLENGLQQVFSMSGRPQPLNLKLPKSNSTKSSRDHYSSYYTPETRDIVYRLYQKDFELFHYPKELPSQ
jgi:hypothetical protein